LTLFSPSIVNSTFTISYYSSAAGWTPYFDINVTSIDAPITILQKSKVRQTTGLDWEKVKLTLSTAMPSNGKEVPLFSAWFLSQQYIHTIEQDAHITQNSISYEVSSVSSKEIMLRGEGSASSKEPLIIINGVIASQEELDALDPNSIKSFDVIKDASSTAIYGSRASNGAIVVTTKSDMNDYVTESDNALNIVYAIDLPYTILGNGQEQSIELQTKEAKAEYKYYCAPKLDGETYLLAEIPDWERLGLISGKANVTYDGTYVGATYINTASTHAKLALTLGTDKRISVKREKLKDFSATKFLGNDVQQVFAYKLTVRNNQNKKVKMVLKDQYPISTQKKIEVTLLKETTPWTANKEDVGVITWEDELAPGETKTYQIGYSVKYPKDMILNL
jgi:TonB-dependent SusC/RagA subfamily outer membrane receptor